MAFENNINNGFSRAASLLSVKALGLGLFLAKTILAVLKVVIIKLLLFAGVKIVVIAGFALFSSVLLSGLLQGASGNAEKYREASLAAISIEDRDYLERYVVPWQVMEAIDAVSGDEQFRGKELARALSPIVRFIGDDRVSMVIAWNGYYRYIYTETEVAIIFTEDWTMLDNAVKQRTGTAPSPDDREVLLAMSGQRP